MEDGNWINASDVPGIMNSTIPDDEIVLHDDECKFLSSLWLSKMNHLPADLFFAGTIPLRECKLVLDTSLSEVIGIDTHFEVSFLCVPQRSIDLTLEESGYSSVLLVKLENIIKKNNKVNQFYAIYGVQHGSDELYLNDWLCSEFGSFENGYATLYPRPADTYAVNEVDQRVEAVFRLALHMWYGVQISLLHPEIKTVFSHPKLRVHEIESSGKKRKRKVKYIRTHYVSISELEAIKKEAVKKSCPAWYVSGHWRHYKNGNTIFIAPYWKGVMRDFKIRMDEARDREVVNPCHI